MTAPRAGLRHGLYLGGVRLSAAIVGYEEVRNPLKTEHQMVDGWTIRTDYGYPFDGGPDLATVYTFTLKLRPRIREGVTDLEQIHTLMGDPAPFIFCPWRFMSEQFTVPTGGDTEGLLQRQSFSGAVPEEYWPVGAGTNMAPYSVVNGSPGSITLGAVDSQGRQAWADGDEGTNRIYYWPAFTVRIVGAPAVAPAKFSEVWTLVLREGGS